MRLAQRSFYKVLTGCLVGSVLLANVGLADPLRLRVDFTPEMVESKEELQKDPSTLSVPSHAAFVSDTFDGKSGKLIIHIQDAHTNFSGQKHLVAVLEDLIQRYGLDLIFVEGGTGNDSLSFLRTYASKDVRRRVALRFLERGEISGEEYLDIVSEHPFLLWGVEDPKLYNRSLEAYSKITEVRGEAVQQLRLIEDRISLVKSHVYPKELLELENHIEAFKKARGKDDEATRLLIEKAQELGIELKAYPWLSKAKEIIQLEGSIDWHLVDEEQVRLSEALMKQDPTLGQLLQGVSTMGSQKIRARSFHERIEPLIHQEQVNMAAYPQLEKYVSYRHLFSGIPTSKLFKEMYQLRDEIYKRLAKDQDALMLKDMSERIKMLEKYFYLRLRPKEFEAYNENTEAFKTLRWTEFLNRKLLDLYQQDKVLPYNGALDQEQKRVADFYRTADKRDEAFVEKMLSKMEEVGREVAIFVCGGYHTPNLTELMREKEISYVVVSPHVLEETDIRNYERVLLGDLKRAH